MDKELFFQTLQSIKYAYYIRGSISVIQSLIALAKKQRPPTFYHPVINKDIMAYCFFLGSLTFLRKVIESVIRIKFKNNSKFISFVSGFFAGQLSLKFLAADSRKFWALFMITRALNFTFGLIQQKGYLKERDWYYIAILGFSQGLLAYAYFYERSNFPASHETTMLRFLQPSLREVDLMRAFNTELEILK